MDSQSCRIPAQKRLAAAGELSPVLHYILYRGSSFMNNGQ